MSFLQQIASGRLERVQVDADLRPLVASRFLSREEAIEIMAYRNRTGAPTLAEVRAHQLAQLRRQERI